MIIENKLLLINNMNEKEYQHKNKRMNRWFKVETILYVSRFVLTIVCMVVATLWLLSITKKYKTIFYDMDAYLIMIAALLSAFIVLVITYVLHFIIDKLMWSVITKLDSKVQDIYAQIFKYEVGEGLYKYLKNGDLEMIGIGNNYVKVISKKHYKRTEVRVPFKFIVRSGLENKVVFYDDHADIYLDENMMEDGMEFYEDKLPEEDLNSFSSIVKIEEKLIDILCMIFGITDDLDYDDDDDF